MLHTSPFMLPGFPRKYTQPKAGTANPQQQARSASIPQATPPPQAVPSAVGPAPQTPAAPAAPVIAPAPVAIPQAAPVAPAAPVASPAAPVTGAAVQPQGTGQVQSGPTQTPPPPPGAVAPRKTLAEILKRNAGR
jgi:hypothetical protein